jgi:hypothetical protein
MKLNSVIAIADIMTKFLQIAQKSGIFGAPETFVSECLAG